MISRRRAIGKIIVDQYAQSRDRRRSLPGASIKAAGTISFTTDEAPTWNDKTIQASKR